MNRQQGFTLIELIMVIVILGILAAVAIPQFVDLRGQANQAAAQGVAGALGSASVINYANMSATGAGQSVSNCTVIGNLLASGMSGYTIQAQAVASGAAQACTVLGGNSSSASFTAIGI